jgi:hypothetical protein
MNWSRCAFLVAAILAAPLGCVAQTAELEIHHSDFHARLGMKIQVVLGDAAGQAAGLKATLSGPGGEKVVLDKKAPLAAEELVTLNFRDLAKGQYKLAIALAGKDGNVLKSAVREFEKPYDGIPRVGIDENNSLRVGGRLFFPFCTYGVGAKDEEIAEWDQQANTLAGYTFSDAEATIEGWKAALDRAAKHNKMVIGPFYGHYWPNGASRRYYKQDGKEVRDREVKIDALTEYVKATKDHPALLTWCWLDEPELSNGDNDIPPKEVRRWTETCHALDAQHPVGTGNGGDGFRRPLENWMHQHRMKFTYEHNGIPGPRKVLLADSIYQDIYPVFGAELEKMKAGSSRPGIKEGWGLNSIENMCVSMDVMKKYNRNLAPFMSAVRTAAFKGPEGPTTPPKPEEVRAVVWANIVHGAKGILWFHYFGPTPPEVKAEMARLLEQMTRLAPAVLGPDYAGKIEKKESAAGGRVDLLARQIEGDDQAVYVFAVNLKEAADKVTFTADFAPKKVEVVDEKRTVAVEGKSFTDAFEPLAVHIYRLER